MRTIGVQSRAIKLAALHAGAVAALVALLIVPATAAARPTLFAATKEGQCLEGRPVNAFLRANHASVLRLVLSPYWAEHGASLACVQAAYAAHYKIYLSLQFSNRWTLAKDAAYFGQVLRPFGPYLWAVGVGNEQDLPAIVLPGQRPRGLSGAAYRAVWGAVEPVMRRLAPHAIRVYGEFTPWAFAANQQGFAHGRPPGVQAIAAHCYHTKFGGLNAIPVLAAWAASKHLPLWCSEMGPALPRKTTPSWAIPEGQASWNRALGRVIARSPNLKMTSYYYSPGL
jgi:hypothetical protein